MKFFRFLTTLIIIQLVTLGARVTAQDITEFEVRVCGPAHPFQADLGPSPLDDNGHVLPSNQCKILQESFSLTERCGFSAGQCERVHSDEVKPADQMAHNQIDLSPQDLSPLDFQCMGSGCEYEYAKSANEFRANLDALDQEQNLNARKEALEVIDSVFAKSTSIKEVIEAQFAEYEFIPYIDPTVQFGLEPVTSGIEDEPAISEPVSKAEPQPVAAKPSPRKTSRIAAAKLLAEFWIDQIGSMRLLQEPQQFVSDQLLELECQLCGTPTLTLIYDLKDSIESAQMRLEHAEKLAKVKQNAMLLKGFSSLIRVMGESLIDVSDSIDAISNKKVELISRSLDIRQ